MKGLKMNRKMLLRVSILIIGSLFLSACVITGFNVTRGSGDLTIESRNVSGFSGVQIDGAGELVIIQGDSESLEIQAEDNIIDKLTSEVRNGTLVLGYRENFLRNTIIPTERITYTLTVIDLSEVTINGAADMEIDSLETDALALNINGAGQVSINQLMADNLTVHISGTATIEIAGQVAQQSITIDGAGNFEAGDLATSSTTVDINGLGNATVWATETLDISIDGGGNLRYYGLPHITQDINGFSDIDNLGEK
jgi:hypothetical protein